MSKTRIITGKEKIEKAEGRVLALLFVEDELALSAAGRAADKATGGALRRAIKRGFSGKKDEVELIGTGKSSRWDLVVLAGLGPRDKLDLDNYRRAAGKIVGAVNKGEKLRCNLELKDPAKPGLSIEDAARSLTEGAILANYRFLDYKTRDKKESPIQTVAIYGEASPVRAGIKTGTVAAEAQCLVRDLINRPAAELTPELFSRKARKLASSQGLECRVWKEAELKKRGMNAILAVGRGSHNPPRLVTISYNGARRKAPDLVMAGKGITFDSGGISLKPSSNMDQMKGDMSGAAEVLAAVVAAARLKLKVNAVALMPLAENLPGGGAQRPGDVIKTASGITVEVKNTDAEGRLVLADALHYATSLRPRVGILDVATLTGACTVALGSAAIGLMGNDEDLLGKISQAGHATGDKTWLLPLWEEYEELIESKVADIINTSTRKEAGTIVGGMFLKQFVGETPWAHLDIASVFWNPKADAYLSAGPSGRGTRLLIKMLESVQ